MHFQTRDVVATLLVGAAGILYLMWAVSAAPPGLSGIRATGLAILALGFAASAGAVVPTFDQLLRGNKAYLAVTSLLGLVAFIAGVLMLVAESETGLAVVMATMVVLWLIATIHHTRLARTSALAHAGPQATETGRQPIGSH